MVGMSVGGFLGGYLYDISHSYVTSWLVSFTAAGLIASLLAMDLMAQGERAQAEAVAAPDTGEPASTQCQQPLLPVRKSSLCHDRPGLEKAVCCRSVSCRRDKWVSCHALLTVSCQ